MKTSAEYYAEKERDLYIETASGKRFHFHHPEFDINDIAHAISLQCRYTGHTKQFFSVAEHSVLVSRLCESLGLGDPFEGLMHDAQEAYLSDIAAPWKVLLPDYRKVEGFLEAKLRAHYGIAGDHTSDAVKRADWLALFIEAYHLMPSQARDWIAPPGVKEQAWALSDVWVPECWLPQQGKQKFLERYELLRT